jgi:hypothetical protein
MVKHDTSRARLLIAMQHFDVHHRGKVTDLGDFTEKSPWPDANYSGLTRHEGRFYPAKVIVYLANPSFDRSRDQTQMAVRVLEKHGFEFVHFGGRGKNPGTCCWDGFPNSRIFNQCLPLTGEEFWDLLVKRARSFEYDSIFEFKGNKRKIGNVNQEETKIEILRPPRDDKTEWSEKPSTIDRGATITGYGKMLDSEGVCSGEIFSKVKIQNQGIVQLCRDLLEWTEEEKIRIKSVDSIKNTWLGFTQETFDVYKRLLDKTEDYMTVHKPIFNKNVRDPLVSLFHLLEPDAKDMGVFAPFNKAQGSSLNQINSQGNFQHFFFACFHEKTGLKKQNSPQFFLTIRPSHIQFGFFRNALDGFTEETFSRIEKMAKSEQLPEILSNITEDTNFVLGIDVEKKTGEIMELTVDEWINLLLDDAKPLISWRVEPEEVVEKGPDLFWDIQRGLKKIAPLFALMGGENPNVELNEVGIDYGAPKSTILDLIKRHRYVILEGVPGTGKTHIFKEIKSTRFFHRTRFLTFHPSSDYSSFIGGIRPGNEDKKLIFNPTKGHFLNILEEAKEGRVLLWIDELNRANVPRVFGDLISLIGNSEPPKLQILNAGLEDEKDILQLTEKQRKNLHIVATMNTSDRSVTPLDAALRRRFSFVRLQPLNKQELSQLHAAFLDAKLEPHVDCFLKLNDILRNSMGNDAILGHSYLFEMIVNDKPRDPKEIVMIWKFSILPNIIDTLTLTQNFEQRHSINDALNEYKIPLSLKKFGNGLGEMILVEVI